MGQRISNEHLLMLGPCALDSVFIDSCFLLSNFERMALKDLGKFTESAQCSMFLRKSSLLFKATIALLLQQHHLNQRSCFHGNTLVTE